MASQSTSQRKGTTDPVKTDWTHYEVEFEHDKVRVLRIKYGPNEKSEMHIVRTMTPILTDQHSRHTHPDGKSDELKGKAGEAR